MSRLITVAYAAVRPVLVSRPVSALVATFLITGLIGASAANAQRLSGKPAFSIGGHAFSTWQDYYSSQYFIDNGKRCGKPATLAPRAVDPSDCTYTSTNPSGDYVPGDVYEVVVVVHIIEHGNGDGQISDALVDTQIDILNEDFRALVGTPGENGYDVAIEFVLAEEDPGGSPTTGITRSVNDSWFNDGGSYWNTLAWDTSRYMNVYTNSAGGNLGYVPDLPQGGIAGNNADRVVVLWSAFGRDSAGGPPYDQGRTLTHEVGHYLGMEHTFSNGCGPASAPACYGDGDLICDTNPESQPNYGCPGSASSCGSSDPIENYMDYSDDTCMTGFTMEQALRIRCSLLNYRPDLWSFAVPPVCGNNIDEGGEDCDGTDDANCAGLCQIDCMCPPPVCGNNVTEIGEDCDGTEDSACPGECEPGCSCPIVCGAGDLVVGKGKSSDRSYSWKADIDNSGGEYDGMDPQVAFVFVTTQGMSSVTVDIPAADPGWAKSRPEKGKYKWKGLIDGIKSVKLTDKTAKKGVWQLKVKGKAVPGAELIDVAATVDLSLTVDSTCALGSYIDP